MNDQPSCLLSRGKRNLVFRSPLQDDIILRMTSPFTYAASYLHSVCIVVRSYEVAHEAEKVIEETCQKSWLAKELELISKLKNRK